MRVAPIFSLLILTSCAAFAGEYQVIRMPGTYTVDGGKVAVEVSLDEANGLLRYGIGKGAESSEPVTVSVRFTHGVMDPKSDWFMFVETPNRIWCFNGADDLILMQTSVNGSGFYSIKMADWVRLQVIEELAELLPEDFRKKLMD